MYSNQYQMDSYPQDQQEQGHYPSQQQYNQPKRGVASQPRNYPRMDAPQSNAPDGQYNANYNTAVVTQQPGVSNTTVALGPPPNYFPLALMTCLFCFWPVSIVALIKSSEVNSAYQAGDIDRAQRASTAARKWSIVSLVLGICFNVVYFAVVYFGVYSRL